MGRQSPRRETVPAESIRQWLDQALADNDRRETQAAALALAEHVWTELGADRLRTNYVRSRTSAGRLGLDPRGFSIAFNDLRVAGYLHRSRGRKTRPGRTILTIPRAAEPNTASASPAEYAL